MSLFTAIKFWKLKKMIQKQFTEDVKLIYQ